MIDLEFPLTFPFSFSGMGGARFKRSVIVAMPENKPEPPPRTKQVHCRGRWRVVKRRMKALACELNYPDCLRVTHHDSIVGAVMQAGAKQRAFWKLCKVRRRPDVHRAERERQRRPIRELRNNPGWIPF